MLQLQPLHVLANCGTWAAEILLKFFKVCHVLYTVAYTQWVYQCITICFHTVNIHTCSFIKVSDILQQPDILKKRKSKNTIHASVKSQSY